jgi:hypothetical protein
MRGREDALRASVSGTTNFPIRPRREAKGNPAANVGFRVAPGYIFGLAVL